MTAMHPPLPSRRPSGPRPATSSRQTPSRTTAPCVPCRSSTDAGSTAVAVSAPGSARSSRNPGAAQRAAEALTRDPAQSNRLIAIQARCDARTVRRIRTELEQAEVIPLTPDRTTRMPLPRRPGRARIAAARLGSSATPVTVASLAGVSRQAAWKALKNQLTGLAELAAATDALAVQATVPCGNCGTLITFDPAVTARKACSAACGIALGRELRKQQQASGESPNRWPPPVPELPKPPDFSQGWCTKVHPSRRGYWTSSDPGEREAAAHMCAGCPVRDPCADWSLALPASDPSVYAGLSHSERMKRRRAWLLQIAAQVRNPRGLPWQQTRPRAPWKGRNGRTPAQGPAGTRFTMM